jgi:hypothetical protein
MPATPEQLAVTAASVNVIAIAVEGLQLSVAVADPKLAVVVGSPHARFALAGHVIVGGVLSMVETDKSQRESSVLFLINLYLTVKLQPQLVPAFTVA